MSFAEFRSSGFGSVISENNSTKYYLRVIGTNASTDSQLGLFVNDKQVIIPTYKGITVSKFTKTMTFVASQGFDIFGSVDVQAQRLIDYINNATEDIIVIQSRTAISTNDLLTSFMNTIGSSVWPAWLKNKETTDYEKEIGYAALYDVKSKNIVGEAVGSLGSDYPAQFDYYFDDLNDLGSIGAGKSLIDDTKEYSGSNYAVKMYQERGAISKYPQLSPTDWLSLRCDFKRDQKAIDVNIDCQLSVQFYKSGAYLKGITISSKPGLDWKTETLTQKVPEDANEISIGFYHGPSTATEGLAFIRNVVIQPTNASVKKGIKNSRLGRFSAPTENFKEGPIGGNTIVRLTRDESIEAIEMQELAGGYWIKILDHNSLRSGKVFATKDEALENVNYDKTFLYSTMNKIKDFRLKDGRYRFRLEYENAIGFIEWEQTSSPEDSTVVGYKLLKDGMINKTVFEGIKLSTNPESRYVGNSKNDFQLGALVSLDNGIRLSESSSANHARLYVWKE